VFTIKARILDEDAKVNALKRRATTPLMTKLHNIEILNP